jgi:RND family efflux transporter MFP subunit
VKKLVSVLAPVVVIAMGAGVYGLLEWAKPDPEKKLEAPRPLSVYVEHVERTNVALNVETSGEVRARTEIDIVAQIAGRVVSVSAEFTEGGRVTPGEALITIEDTDFRFALLQAEAVVANAEVGMQQALAAANVARKQLKGATNASDLALNKPQVARAQAGIKAARADLAQAQVNLDRTRITLPFTGRIVSTSVDVGQYITPGTPLGKAFSTDVVEVRLPLNDSQLASLDLPIGFIAGEEGGLLVNLRTTVAGREQNWQGHLTRLDASIERETRMLYGLVEVHSPYDDNVSENGMPLAVGLYVRAQIEGREINGAYVIPRDALRAGNQVYVVNEKGRLEVRSVEVTHSSSRRAIIASGLAPAERVVVSSIRNPIQGMALEPLQQTYKETANSDYSTYSTVGG